jgi:hypothetical protein
MKITLLTLLFLTLTSCSLFESNETGSYKKSTNIQNQLKGNLPKEWISINRESSDYAITNKISNSVFLVISACRKFEASNLEYLTSAILTGVDVVNVIEKKIIRFQERDALDMTVLGKVDGVERFFHLITLQKNNCIYDLVLIATSEKNLNQDNRDFSNFIQRINFN